MLSPNIVLGALISLLLSTVTTEEIHNDAKKLPTVFVAILVRNKAHILPYFLTLFTQMDYPKNRIFVWIRSDHNMDNSAEILQKWVTTVRSQYHRIDLQTDNTTSYFGDAKTTSSWSQERYNFLIKLRQEGLDSARESWADYVWFLDCDSLITNAITLRWLIQKDKMIIAPMLSSTSMYSNFWCGMTSSFYYRRTDEYPEILNRKQLGCYAVPMVHSAVLINLRTELSDALTFIPEKIRGYSGPVDDIIAFAIAANKSSISLFVCNDLYYGYTTVPLEENETIEDDKNHLVDLKLQISVDEPVLPVDKIFGEFLEFPVKQKYGFDQIFVINLKRRPERRKRMEYCLNELGIDVTFVNAVDGKNLSEFEIDKMGIKMMPAYEDPHFKRPMKKGEIGCFLSHFNIWKTMVEENLEKVIILEDDVRFEKYFLNRLRELIVEIHRFHNSWDLVYLGRKILDPKQESFVEGSNILVHPYYTYWTIGYILKFEGARKLLRANPLDNLIPVDEFLPIMYNQHNRNDWKEFFPKRDLKAFSVNPLIIHPMKYTNDVGYVSDTETSNIVKTESFVKNEL